MYVYQCMEETINYEILNFFAFKTDLSIYHLHIFSKFFLYNDVHIFP